MESNTVYDLHMHEMLKWQQNGINCSVVRVPGGWLYQLGNKQPVYVPFTPEGKLAEMIKIEKRFQRVAIKRIVDIILKYYDLNEVQLHEKTRKPKIVKARYQVIYFVSKYMSKMTLNRRGEVFDFSHDMVLHALKQVNNYIETEPEYRVQIIEIDNIIKLALSTLEKTTGK